MGENNYLIRRIRPTEEHDLRRVFRASADNAAFYPEHEKWFDHAVDEFKETPPRRLAFGLFDYIIEEDQKPEWRLVAFSLLKRADYDPGVEIKGPFVDVAVYKLDSLASATKSENLQKFLLQKVIRFCEVRGYPKVQIELPQLDHKRVSLVLNLNFKVTSLREKYRPGDHVYIMEKALGEIYQGDPFDLEKVADWFMTTVLPCRRIANTSFFLDTHFILRHAYQVPVARRIDRGQSGNGVSGSLDALAEKIAFKCELVILSASSLASISEQQLRQLYSDEKCVHYLLTDCDSAESFASAKQKCDGIGIRLLALNELRHFGGGKQSTFSIPFAEEAVGGVVSVLEPEHAVKLGDKTGLVYFLMSDLGYRIDYDTEKKVIAFYSPISTQVGRIHGEIWGMAVVDNTHNSSFEKAYKYFDENYVRFLTEADLLYLQAYSEELFVLALKCVEVRSFDPPIPLEDIPESMGARAYLFQQLIDNVSSAAYIHINIKSFLIERGGISMTTDKAKSSFLPKSVNWLRVIAESATGLPGGKLVLGGFLKQYDSEIDSAKREAMEDRIVALINLNKDIVLDQVRALFGDVGDEAKTRAALSMIAPLLNEQIKAMKDSRDPLTSDQMKECLSLTKWPFPGLPEILLNKELHALFSSRSDEDFIRDLAYRNGLSLRREATLSGTLTDIVRSIPSQRPDWVRDFVADMLTQKPSSKILSELLALCVAWSHEQE